jgi:hypothetical protein
MEVEWGGFFAIVIFTVYNYVYTDAALEGMRYLKRIQGIDAYRRR